MSTTTTATPPDFESFERFNNEFSAMIDNMIPRNFGASSGNKASSSAMETADEIIDRNRAKRQTERHRKVISGGKAGPETIGSSLVSATTLPLANVLKRRHADEPSTSVGNGHKNGASRHSDDDDDEEESRTRVVTKKNKLSRDAFSTKKQTGKVKAKLSAQTSAKDKILVSEKDSTSIPKSLDGPAMESLSPSPSTAKPDSQAEPLATSFNPFKIPASASPTTTLPTLQPGINNIFSSQSTDTPITPLADTPKSAVPPAAAEPARERTGMTPPPELHGKERKRWRKKMKKMQSRKDGVEKGGDGEDDVEED